MKRVRARPTCDLDPIGAGFERRSAGGSVRVRPAVPVSEPHVYYTPRVFPSRAGPAAFVLHPPRFPESGGPGRSRGRRPPRPPTLRCTSPPPRPHPVPQVVAPPADPRRLFPRGIVRATTARASAG